MTECHHALSDRGITPMTRTGGRAKNCEIKFKYMKALEKWAINQAKRYGLLDEYIETRLRGYNILEALAEWDLWPVDMDNEQMNDEQMNITGDDNKDI